MRRVKFPFIKPSQSPNHILSCTLLLLLHFILCIPEANQLASNQNSKSNQNQGRNINSNSNTNDDNNGGIGISSINVNMKKIQQLLDLTLEDVDRLNLESVFQDNIKGKLVSKDNHRDRNQKQNQKQNHQKQNYRPSTNEEAGHLLRPSLNSETVEKEQIILNHHNHQQQKKEPQENNIDNNNDSGGKDTRKFKKLKVPEGTSLSLAVQVSRPNILPGLFFQHEGIVLDAVVEVPIWFDLDVYVKAVYDHQKPGSKPPSPMATLVDKLPLKPLGGNKPLLGGQPSSDPPLTPAEGRLLGNERCFLYTQLEMIAARTMEIPQSVAHACLLRTICEIHSIVGHSQHYQNASIMFELIRLFLSPSFGEEDDCYKPYLKAERTGKRKSMCYRYISECPISFTSVIMTNFVTYFSHN